MAIDKTWLVVIGLEIASILFYKFTSLSPLREILLLVCTVILILTVMVKFFI